MDRLRRERGMAIGRDVLDRGRRASPAVIVAGDWLPMIRVLTGRTAGPLDLGRARFVHHLEPDDVALVRGEGRALYVAPGALGSASARFGEDPASFGAAPLDQGVTP